MKRLVSTIAITLFWGLSLSSCTESAPEMSDDQILLLFSSTSLFSTSADAPKTIPKKAEECVRLLSGLEEAVFKDMPQEMLGQLKTECRQTISERLRDPALNPKNLKLEHVETAEFAQRLTTVRAKSQEEAKAFAARENERREAELAKQEQDQQRRRIQEAAEAIKNAQTQLASIKDDLPKRLTEAATACAEFDQAKEDLRKRDRRSPVLNRAWRPNVCQKNYAERASRQLHQIEQAVEKMASDKNSLFLPSMPFLGEADPNKITAEIEKMQETIRDMKNA
ncbi:hypothetical protein I3J13_20205 [Agrobacterium sp. MOPV5]|uniref:hypothetical protein n=1 Tax=Agrobacterium leguminum TaxID=2792015 RepID=UPI0018C2D739|nr:hypothetical protein [Agrobacterium leguminum]MBG0511107.1 hypothetical protein [Agrobacterium leguminum]